MFVYTIPDVYVIKIEPFSTRILFKQVIVLSLMLAFKNSLAQRRV